MIAAEVPHDWPDEVKAGTVLTVIHELIEQMDNPRWRAAAQAALRLPADRYLGGQFDALSRRFLQVADDEGYAGSQAKERAEAYRGYWITGAKRLADALGSRLSDLNRDPDGWSAYRLDMPPRPPAYLPITFDRTDVLYRFEGRRGVQAITYRWITATKELTYYPAIAYYYSDPDGPVGVTPLANCSTDGQLFDLPEGGRAAKLSFGRTLAPGESTFFAYTTTFYSDRDCRPIISYECKGASARQFFLRAQFDPECLPRQCWRYDMRAFDLEHRLPAPDDPRTLQIGGNGYVEVSFPYFEPGHKYGMGWLW